MNHNFNRPLPWLIGLMLVACGEPPGIKSPTQATALAPAAASHPRMPPVDEVFGMFYARVLEYALRNHHPGGKFSLAHWDRKDSQLALPEPFLNRILSASGDFRALYVPPERLQHPPRTPDGKWSKEPLRDRLDGEDVFLYSLSGMDWIAPSTVRVEYKRFRASGDFMWQPVTFKQTGDDWEVIDEGLRLGDNYNKNGSARLIESKITPGPNRSIKVFPVKEREAAKPN